MKCKINFGMVKFVLIAAIVMASLIQSTKKDVKPPKANQYKEDKAVHHSLFREKDSPERMSSYAQYIPRPPLPKKDPNKKLPDPEKIIAMRIIEQYKKIFDYLDYKPVDDLIIAAELSEAFRDFYWPKSNPEVTDDMDYSKLIIAEYDSDNKNSLNFLEFCKFMEDLWNSADMLQEQKCNVGFNRANDVFKMLFHWLDRESDGLISPEDMIYGISRIMIRDVDLKEVQATFAKYDPKKTGKINLDSFLLAIANGKLDSTFKDEFNTNTFIK